MPVSVQCPACQKQFNVKDEYAGKVGRCTACKATFTMSPTAVKAAASGPAAPAAKTAVIGRFQIRQKLGAGAFGTVYRAYDPQLEREVALKVPQPGVLSTPQRVERFLREAKASAQLTHPAIVPVYDAGTDGGRHYIASKFIAGKPLADAVDENGIDPQRAARIVAELGDGLFYAHMAGVVHRDIKPANVMLDVDDHPHLMDFGLASWESSTEKLTHDGAVLGTPAYMSPEQAAGQQGEAKMESDQYSLGVVLYEILTGRTPFDGPPQIVIHAVINKEPPKPTTIKKGIPRDLETICLKAMAKRPKDRYGNCQELARDLRRWLDGEPIQARRLGLVERTVRWARKEPKLAAAGGMIVALLVALAGVLTWKVGALASEVLAEQQQKSAALAARDKTAAELAAEAEEHDATRRGNYLHQVRLIDSKIGDGDLMAPYRLGRDIKAELRGWEFNHLMLAGEGVGAAVRVFGNRNSVQSVAFNAQSSQIVCANFGGIVQIHDLASGQEIRSFDLPGGWEEWHNARFALSGNGERLVAVRFAGLTPEFGHGPMMPMPAMPIPGPKTKKIPDEVSVWDIATGKRLLALKATLNPGPAFVAVNEDGSKIALATGSKYELALYDGRTGEPLHSLEGCVLIKSLTFDRSGESLFAVDGGETTVTKAMQGTRYTEKDELKTQEIDGKVVIVCVKVKVPETYTYTVNETVCVPNSIKAWDVSTGAPKTPLVSRPTTQRLALKSDGKEGVLIGSSQATVARIVKETVPNVVTVKKSTDVNGVKVWTDEKRIVPVEVSKVVMQTVAAPEDAAGPQIDDVATGQAVGNWAGAGGAMSMVFSPDGLRAATAQPEPCRFQPLVELWDAKTRAKLLRLRLPDDVPFLQIASLVWSPDSMHLAGWGRDGRVLVWSAVGGRSLAFRDDLGPVNSVVWSPDGKQLAAVSNCTSRGAVFDPATSKLTYALSSVDVAGVGSGASGGCLGLSFTGNGGQLVRTGIGTAAGGSYGFGGLNTGALRWANPSGEPLVEKSGGRVLAVSGDGSRLVVLGGTRPASPGDKGESGNSAVLRDAASGDEIAGLADFRLPAERVEFSPDGKFVAAASVTWMNGQRRGTVRVWNAATGAIVVAQENAQGTFAFDPKSSRFASASALIAPSPPPGVITPMPGPQPTPMPAPAPAPKAIDKVSTDRRPVLLAMLEPGEKPQSAQPEPKPKQDDAPKDDGPKDKTLPPKFEPPKTILPEVTIFNLATGKADKTIDGLTFNVRRLEFSPDGQYVVVLSVGLRLVELSSGKDVLVTDDATGEFVFLKDHFVYADPRPTVAPMVAPPGPMPAPAPAVSPAALRQDDDLFEVSAQTPQPAPKAVPEKNDGPPPGENLAPPGPVCFPGMLMPPAQVNIKFWNTKTRAEVGSHFMMGKVTALTASRAGDLVAVATLPEGSAPAMPCGPPPTTAMSPVLNVLGVDGKLVAAIHGHSDRVNCLAFDPAGERLATASEDGTVRVWSLGGAK